MGLGRYLAASSDTEHYVTERARECVDDCRAYVAVGLIPLAPYMVIGRARIALALSVIATAAALTAFGYVEGHFTGTPPLRSPLYTTLIGGLAAAAAFLVALAIV